MSEAPGMQNWHDIGGLNAPDIPAMGDWLPALATRGKRIVYLLHNTPEAPAARRLYLWVASLAENRHDPVWLADPILEYRCAELCVYDLMSRLMVFDQPAIQLRSSATDPLGFAEDAEAWIWAHMGALDAGDYENQLVAQAAVALKH